LADSQLRHGLSEAVQIVSQPGTDGLHGADGGAEPLTVGPDRVALTALELGRNRLELALQGAGLVGREQAAATAAGGYQRDSESSPASQECAKRLAHPPPDFRRYGG
jgi:hypothetical protein